MDVSDRLREAGFKATPIRAKLLEIFAAAKSPLTFEEVRKAFGKSGIDQVTLYRGLNAFKEKGLIREMRLNSSTPHYELLAEEHHHIVCTECGRIEDFSLEECEAMEKRVLKKSASFGEITHHSIELYGICKKCLSK